MFDRIVYVSRAAAGIGPSDVYDIIRRAHNRNGADGLTGGLLFLDGYFIQVLEGEPFRLDPCYARILADPRHHELDLRSRVRSTRRLFEGEWMALRQREQIPAPVLAQFGYVPGVPQAQFDAATLVEFVRRCCGLGTEVRPRR